MKYGRLPELEKQLASEEGKLESTDNQAKMLREEVTEDEIAEIISRWTGIPITRLVESERDKLLRLDEILHERVIGQDEAVQTGGGRRHQGPCRDQGSAAADWFVYLSGANRGW